MENELRLSTDKKRMIYNGDNKLIQKVQHMVNGHEQDYDDGVVGYLNDVTNSGCQSGIESGLIYYTDTVKFYKKYKVEIQSILKELLSDCGGSIPDLFGEKWDNDDMFAEQDQNQNLLAWFGFEEVCNMMINSIE